MQLELPNAGDHMRPIGAAVVRAGPGGGVVLELGPADGAPQVRVRLSHEEALRLSATVRAVANGGDETILIVDQ